MDGIEKIILKLRENMPILTERYSVKSLETFGSYVRGQETQESDLDILVDFHETIDLFSFIEIS